MTHAFVIAALTALSLGGPIPAAAQDGAPLETRAGPLVVRSWPGQERLAVRLLTATRQSPPLPALPRSALAGEEPVIIYLAPDPARFDSLTYGRAPEWGAGVALPGDSRIVLPAYGSDRAAIHDLRRILRHELAHIALHRYLAPTRPRRWFDEGYARWAAGEWNWEAAWQLRLAFLMNRAPPLDSLALRWPTGRRDAQVAYLLATSAVGYLVEEGGGAEGLGIFLRRWKETGSFETALRRTYGFTSGQFEEAWRDHVRSRYGWTAFFFETVVFWFLAGILVLVLFMIRRRRDRRRLERMRTTDPPDRPAYWLGEYELPEELRPPARPPDEPPAPDDDSDGASDDDRS